MVVGGFVNRVVNYIVNDLVVERLANNLEFQRFAVRTSKKLEHLSKMGFKMMNEFEESLEEKSKNSQHFKDRD